MLQLVIQEDFLLFRSSERHGFEVAGIECALNDLMLP